VPRFHEPLAPLLDLRWEICDAARNRGEALFSRRPGRARRCAGGGETSPALRESPPFLDRRARLSIEHRETGPTCDVVWCAPEDAADALAVKARGAHRYWVPSRRAAALLNAAGIARDITSITRPGFPVRPNLPPRPIEGAIIVARAAGAASRLAPLTAALTAFRSSAS